MNLENVRCGNCKFWGKPNQLGIYRNCTAIRHDKRGATNDWNDKNCEFNFNEPEKQLEIDNERADNKAVAIDGSGYYAAIRCREDFGCVLFVEKEKI